MHHATKIRTKLCWMILASCEVYGTARQSMTFLTAEVLNRSSLDIFLKLLRFFFFAPALSSASLSATFLARPSYTVTFSPGACRCACKNPSVPSHPLAYQLPAASATFITTMNPAETSQDVTSWQVQTASCSWHQGQDSRVSRLYTLKAYACADLWRKDCEASEVTAQVLLDVISS